MIRYYEELSREVDYREFRAQWRIKRRELDTARVQFLAQEQARLDSLREQVAQETRPQASGTQIPVVSAQRGEYFDEKPGGDKSAVTPQAPKPSLVSLIASGVRTDALLRSEQQTNLSRSEDSVSAAAEEAVSQESGEHDQAFKVTSNTNVPDSKTRKTWESPAESVAQLGVIKEKGSGRKTWEALEGDVKIASPLPKSHSSDSSVQFAMYGEKRKSTDEEQTPGFGVRDVALQASTPHVADSSLQDILYPSTPSAESSGSDTQPLNFVTQSSESDAENLVTGHLSDSLAQESLCGGLKTTTPSSVGTSSAQGHPSDSSAQHFLYGSNLDGDNAEMSSSPHGHPSDSSVGGLMYPAPADTPTPHSPRLSSHGHPSDSQISLSQDARKGQILHHSSRSTWQHPSDASVHKLLSDINILGESQQTTRGTPPASSAQDILYPSLDTQSVSLLSGSRGTPPQSVAQDILYPAGEESGKTQIGSSSRGAPPSSVIQDIMYPRGEGSRGEDIRVSTRGHEPEVKVKKIMYYVKTREGKETKKYFSLSLFRDEVCSIFNDLHLPLHSEKHEKNEFQLSVNYSRLFLNFHYLALSVAEKTRVTLSADQRQGKKQF